MNLIPDIIPRFTHPVETISNFALFLIEQFFLNHIEFY